MEKREMSKNYRKQTTQHEKWLKMWAEFEQQIDQLPAWKRKILIDDLGVAFRSRIAVLNKPDSEDQSKRNACTTEAAFAMQIPA